MCLHSYNRPVRLVLYVYFDSLYMEQIFGYICIIAHV